MFFLSISIYRLEFKEIPTLDEIPIDTQSMLKWCPDFISKEEGDALFKHLMEGICLHTTAKFRKLADFYSFSELNFEHTKISMYGKPVSLVSRSTAVKTISTFRM